MEALDLKKIRLLIVDNSELVCDSMAGLLTQRFGEIRTSYSGRKSINLALEFKPDVITVDLLMPDMDGIETSRAILSSWPQAKIMILSVQTVSAYLWDRARSVGIRGYLSKNVSPQRLVAAIVNIYYGNIVSSQDLDEILPETAVEVLRRICDGLDNKQIAEELCMTEAGVKYYTRLLYQKIGVSSDTATSSKRAQAISWAFSQGIVLASTID